MRIVHEILRAKGHDVWSVTPDTTVFDALRLMADKEIGAVMVAEKGEILGVFSERDYARKVVLRGGSSRDLSVSQIMSRGVVKVTALHSIADCMTLMTEHRVRHLPVIDDGRLVGVVSIGDVVKSRLAEQRELIDQLEQYIRVGGA